MVPRAATEGSQMAYGEYRCLRVRLDRGVAFVTIDHPPINLLDLALMRELDGIGKELEGDDVPAELAERWGYLNRALPPAELGPFVERLAFRIASFPADAIALAKAAVNAAELPTEQGLLEEAACFNGTLGTAAARQRMARFLELGGQTRAVELHLGSLVDRLAE